MIEQFENKIINADCLDILKQLPDKCIDLVLTDPPYGIGIDGQKLSVTAKNKKHWRKEHQQKNWDNGIPPKEIFDEMKRVSKNMIVWGANYFNEYLEQGHKGWIVWDKGQRNLTMSDCELIFSSFQVASRIEVVNRVELLKDNTIHPTQKPLKLIEKLLCKFSKEGDLIADFFSGSGTTAVASWELKRKFICVEKDFDYWKASCKRLEDHQRQGVLF